MKEAFAYGFCFEISDELFEYQLWLWAIQLKYTSRTTNSSFKNIIYDP